jgi:hypothetical protein
MRAEERMMWMSCESSQVSGRKFRSSRFAPAVDAATMTLVAEVQRVATSTEPQSLPAPRLMQMGGSQGNQQGNHRKGN